MSGLLGSIWAWRDWCLAFHTVSFYSSSKGLDCQPKQCTVTREIPENYHTFVWFDSFQMGNLMIPVLSVNAEGCRWWVSMAEEITCCAILLHHGEALKEKASVQQVAGRPKSFLTNKKIQKHFEIGRCFGISQEVRIKWLGSNGWNEWSHNLLINVE